MRKFLLGILVLSAFGSACKKETPQRPVTNVPPPKHIPSKSFVKITIDEKTIEARDTFVTPFESNNYYPMLSSFTVKNSDYTTGKFDKIFSINTICGGLYYNGKLKLVISGTSGASDNTSPTDSFRTLNLSSSAFYVENLTDSPKVVYSILTGSKIFISNWTDEYSEGKLKLQLRDNKDGALKNAEGEFKIYRR